MPPQLSVSSRDETMQKSVKALNGFAISNLLHVREEGAEAVTDCDLNGSIGVTFQ
jgi:hypothetical protein